MIMDKIELHRKTLFVFTTEDEGFVAFLRFQKTAAWKGLRETYIM